MGRILWTPTVVILVAAWVVCQSVTPATAEPLQGAALLKALGEGIADVAEEIADALLSAAADRTPSISTAESGERVAASAV